MVLFSGAAASGCGFAPSAMGPFYCPRDRKVYLDLSFFQELSDRFGAPGDFVGAYVIPHEVGHHVQNLLGIMDEADVALGQSAKGANDFSVRLELQADCFAGAVALNADRARTFDGNEIWPNHSRSGRGWSATTSDLRATASTSL